MGLGFDVGLICPVAVHLLYNILLQCKSRPVECVEKLLVLPGGVEGKLHSDQSWHVSMQHRTNSTNGTVAQYVSATQCYCCLTLANDLDMQ